LEGWPSWRPWARRSHGLAARADLINRDFHTDAAGLDQRWCGDITYIQTWEGWAYLATVMDIASRRVVGWAMAEHLRTDLVEQALPTPSPPASQPRE
jgi:transposase InsO family protein